MIRKLADALGVAAAEDDVVGDERVAQVLGRVEHGGDPRLLAAAFEAFLAKALEERFLPAQAQRAELERRDHVIGDQRRSEAGAEPEEQHASAVIRAKRLHRGVVDDADGTLEGFRIVELHPAIGQIARFAAGPS